MRQWTIALLILIALVRCSAISSHHDTDAEFSEVPIIRAIKTAMRQASGHVMEAKFEKSGAFIVYHVQIVDSNNKKHHIYVDAESGQVRNLNR